MVSSASSGVCGLANQGRVGFSGGGPRCTGECADVILDQNLSSVLASVTLIYNQTRIQFKSVYDLPSILVKEATVPSYSQVWHFSHMGWFLSLSFSLGWCGKALTLH